MIKVYPTFKHDSLNRCEAESEPDEQFGPIDFKGNATTSDGTSVTVDYTLTLTGREEVTSSEVECQGVLEWSGEICGMLFLAGRYVVCYF